MRSFITSADVAQELHMSITEFYRARPKLTAEHGFPEPLRGFQNPHRYNAHAVAAWMRSFEAGVTMPLARMGPAELQAMQIRQAGGHNVHLLKMAQRVN